MSQSHFNAEEPVICNPIVANNCDKPMKVRHLVKELLSTTAVSCLFGNSNAGKTAIAIALGAAVVKDQEFAGLRVRGGAVWHQAAEAPGSVANRTIPLLRNHPEAAPYYICPSAIDLRSKIHVRALAAKIVEHNDDAGIDVALIIIDTLVLCFGDGDENSSRDMTAAVEGAKLLAQLTGAHVMLIHHAGKGDAESGRGSSALRCNVDTELALKVGDHDGERRSTLSQMKQRDGAIGAPLQFVIDGVAIGQDDEGEEITAAVARHVPYAASSAPTQPAGKPDAQKIARAVAVEVAIRKAEAETPGKTFNAVRLRDLCDGEAFASVRGNPDSFRKAVNRALEERARSSDSAIQPAPGGWTLRPSATA